MARDFKIRPTVNGADINEVLFSYSLGGNLSAGSGPFRIYNDSGRTLTFVKARASVGTAPTTQAILIDINKGGTSIWASTQGNRLSIAAAGNTATQTSFDTTTIADGDYLTVDIDQVGSGTVGANLVVQMWCRG